MKINETVRQMYPPRYTRSQAAEALGKDQDTLRRWEREGIYRPSDSRTFGKLEVGLYTDDDLMEMRKIAKTLKPGRKSQPTASVS